MTKSKENLIYGASGGFAGLMNGLFGGGGGMLLVPVLNNVFSLEQRKAHATSMLAILPISIISAFIYIFNGYFDAIIGLPTIIGVTLGGLIGATFLKNVSNKFLTYAFSALMIFAGMKMLIL